MLQFGAFDSSVVYRPRPAVFGIAERDGLIACVRIERPERTYIDLPGGGVDEDKTEQEALAREFREETGLKVSVTARLTEAAQYFFRTTGEARNNIGGYWAVTIEDELPDTKVEADHTLIWLTPADAIRLLRHEAHVWAVAAWMRR